MECGDCLVCRLNENVNCPYCIIKQFGLFEHPTPKHVSYSAYPDPKEGRGIQQHEKVTPNFYDKNLGSEIEPKAGSPKMGRLIKLNRRMKLQDKQSLNYAISYMKVVTSQLQLPGSLLNRAVELLKKTKGKGHKLEVTSLACIGLASEEMRIPVSSAELSKFGVERKKISKMKRKIIRELDLNTAPLRAEDFTEKVCTQLGIPEWSEKVRDLISNTNSVGRNPLAVVGGCVWHISKSNGHEVKRNEIAEVCGVTDATIQNNSEF